MLRPTRIDDYEEIIPFVKRFHRTLPFSKNEIDEAVFRRVLAMAVAMPNFFTLVSVGENGKVRGGMIGCVDQYLTGEVLARDITIASLHEVDEMIDEFKKWARGKGADAIVIGDLVGIKAYGELLESKDLKKSGSIFVEVL